MKKLFSILLALVMLLSVSVPVFAAETTEDVSDEVKATLYNVELNSDGIVSVSDANGDIIPLSSISGYNQGDVSSNSSGFLVWVDSSGIGGMGVTVITNCSNWDGTITFNLASDTGSYAVQNATIPTNGESQWHNLIHGLPSTPAYYIAVFSGIPAGYTVHAQVWIYG